MRAFSLPRQGQEHLAHGKSAPADAAVGNDPRKTSFAPAGAKETHSSPEFTELSLAPRRINPRTHMKRTWIIRGCLLALLLFCLAGWKASHLYP